jgi:hypothetical protein
VGLVAALIGIGTTAGAAEPATPAPHVRTASPQIPVVGSGDWPWTLFEKSSAQVAEPAGDWPWPQTTTATH